MRVAIESRFSVYIKRQTSYDNYLSFEVETSFLKRYCSSNILNLWILKNISRLILIWPFEWRHLKWIIRLLQKLEKERKENRVQIIDLTCKDEETHSLYGYTIYCSRAQHSTAQHSTALHSTALHNTFHSLFTWERSRASESPLHDM